MPIIHPSAPEGGSEIVKESFSRVLTAPGARTYRFLTEPEAQIAHGSPHKIYTVPVEALLNGKLLDAAVEVAWSYPLFADSEPVGEIEISLAPEGQPEFRAFYGGPFAEATTAALRRATNLRPVTEKDYEVRFLKIPPVYFAALWLHESEDDILMPLREPPGRLESNKPYHEQEVISALQASAARAARFEDRSPPA